MGVGLQVWNAAGQLIFDTPDRVGRIVGSFLTGGTYGTSGTVNFTVPAGCTGFWFTNAPATVFATDLPNVTISGGVLSWACQASTTVYYGYY